MITNVLPNVDICNFTLTDTSNEYTLPTIPVIVNRDGTNMDDDGECLNAGQSRFVEGPDFFVRNNEGNAFATVIGEARGLPDRPIVSVTVTDTDPASMSVVPDDDDGDNTTTTTTTNTNTNTACPIDTSINGDTICLPSLSTGSLHYITRSRRMT